ncbi:hypothetical protein WJX84_006099 [Apatococcus fuscideae]|uniref:Uncharacterized protein n=1 Tax=Apatococcus fuscideae TaxID=2026836 RepID=A0AAW1T197_9CHLO
MLARALSRHFSRLALSNHPTHGPAVGGTSSRAYGAQADRENEEEDKVQLTWPLPPEVLAQMEPSTRLMLIKAMQSSGAACTGASESSTQREPSSSPSPEDASRQQRQESGASASSFGAAPQGQQHWTFPTANADPPEYVRPRLPPFADSAECSNQVAQMLVKARTDDVQLLDVRQHCSFADFMVLATGRSHRHVITAARAIAYQLSCHHEDGSPPPRPTVHGSEGSDWILVDAGNVLAHVFLEGAREQYNLEELWSQPGNTRHVTSSQGSSVFTLDTIRMQGGNLREARCGVATLLVSAHTSQDCPKVASSNLVTADQLSGAGAPSLQLLREEDPDYEHVLVANGTGMQLSFLGTSSDNPTTLRGEGCTALRTLRSIWLFDCGEDAQRGLLTHPYLRAGKIDRIFISKRSPQTMLGLPGLLCTISAGRDMASVSSDVPVHIYGPAGVVEFLRGMLLLSDTFLGMPVIVHELVDCSLSEEERQPQCVNQRARLWHMAVPPDQLNADGYYDARPQPFQARYSKRPQKAGFDARANTRPLPLPRPGDPTQQNLDPGSLTWTIQCDDEFMVTAFTLPAPEPTWAYTIIEADRAGHLDPQRAIALGVSPGIAFSQLKEGLAVPAVGPNGESRMVHPKQVISPDLPGRKVGIIGCAADTLPAAKHVVDADVLIHHATSPTELSSESHTVSLAAAASAGKLAQEAQGLTSLPESPGEQMEGSSSLGPAAASNTSNSPRKARNSHHLQDGSQRRRVIRAVQEIGFNGSIVAADEMQVVCVERRALTLSS